MVAFGSNIRFVLSVLLENPSWEIAAGVTAGCVGAILALPFKRHIRRLAAVLLWLLTGWLALLASQFVGLLAQLWFISLKYNQPFSFDIQAFSRGLNLPLVAGFVALFGLLPMLVIGLLSYPVFARLRERLCRAGPA